MPTDIKQFTITVSYKRDTEIHLALLKAKMCTNQEDTVCATPPKTLKSSLYPM